MDKDNHKTIPFLFCLYIFLHFFYLVFARFPIKKNAKLVDESNAVLYSNKIMFLVLSFAFENSIQETQKRNRFSLEEVNQFSLRDQFNSKPFISTHFIKKSIEEERVISLQTTHLKIFEKILKEEFYFNAHSLLCSSIMLSAVNCIFRSLDFTGHIRPPPEYIPLNSIS